MTKKITSGTLSTRKYADKKSKQSSRPPKEDDVLKKMQGLHSAGKLRIHPHANQRMGERNVIYFEVLQALSKAKHQPSKDRFSDEHRTWEYSMEGRTLDSKLLRIGIAFENDQRTGERVLVVTVIDVTDKNG